MQTMSALVRLAGDLNMTVKVHDVTPAEAFLLMHIHDAATKDVFEDPVLGADVERTRLDERERLAGKYPEHTKLIQHLFPGRNAADIPETFDELQDVPLEVQTTHRMTKADKVRAKAKAKAGAPENPPLMDEAVQQALMTGKGM